MGARALDEHSAVASHQRHSHSNTRLSRADGKPIPLLPILRPIEPYTPTRHLPPSPTSPR